MPNETIIAKETEKNKRCTRYCSKAGSSASLSLIARYSPLNVCQDVLLSPVSYRSSSGAASIIDHKLLGEVKGQAVGVVNINYFFTKSIT